MVNDAGDTGSGGPAGASAGVPGPPRSWLTDIADQTVLDTGRTSPDTGRKGPDTERTGPGTGRAGAGAAPEPPDGDEGAEAPGGARTGVAPAKHADGPAPAASLDGSPLEQEAARARRRQFLAQLGEFRRSQVLVPVGAPDGQGGGVAPLTVDMGGVRWILAFTGEAALARFAVARGEEDRQWPYRGVWGAALLDAAVPTVAESGMPCGVLVNAADGARGLVLPPVVGVVPEEVAVDRPGGPGSSPGPAASPGSFDSSPGAAASPGPLDSSPGTAGPGRQEER
ncbi:SseB family protein [Streptomyces collinus]|uniref:SseB family protein n=1 Tax=Streptomyces collinus TaxID=42684 RepID=UPI003980C8BC